MYIYQDLPKEFLHNTGSLISNVKILPANSDINDLYFNGYYTEENLQVLEADLIDNYTWINLAAVPETCSFESGPVEIDDTTFIGSFFKAKIPHVTLKGIQVCNSLLLSRCYAVVTDMNGRKRILGRFMEPAVFRYREVTGEAYSNLNHIEIQINITSHLSPAFLA